MKLSEETSDKLCSLAVNYAKNRSHDDRIALNKFVESILTPPVQDGGEIEDESKLLEQLAEELEGKIKAFVLKGFKIGAKKLNRENVKLRAELEEAKKEIDRLRNLVDQRTGEGLELADEIEKLKKLINKNEYNYYKKFIQNEGE